MPQKQLLFSPEIDSLSQLTIFTLHLITQDRPQGIPLDSLLFLPPCYKSYRVCLLSLFMKFPPTPYSSIPACMAIMKALIALCNTSWRFRQEDPSLGCCAIEGCAYHKHKQLLASMVTVTQDVALSTGSGQPAIPTSTLMTNTVQAPGKHFSLSPPHISFFQTKGSV